MLAADVNAAAEALDNLKHSLRRQSPDPVQVSVQRASGPYLVEAASTPTKLFWQPLPVMSAHAPPQVPVASLLPTDPLNAVGLASGRLDLRVFLAALAMSATIGVVLYIFLAAG
jgi:hypothetical protein